HCRWKDENQFEFMSSVSFKCERDRVSASFTRVFTDHGTVWELGFEREFDLASGELVVNRALDKSKFDPKSPLGEFEYSPAYKHNRKIAPGKNQTLWITDMAG